MVIAIVAMIVAAATGIQSRTYQKQIQDELHGLLVDTHVKTTELGIELDDLRHQKEELSINGDRTTVQETSTSSSCTALVNGCYEQMEASGENTQPATTTIVYVNQAKGLSIKLPYNGYWGTSKYVLPPYEEEYTTKESNIL